MSLSNAPKVLRGAFVEYGASVPPLTVVFQFNPLELERNRALSFASPRTTMVPVSGGKEGGTRMAGAPAPLREFHQETRDLIDIRDGQKVTVEEETLGFDIRLDATDRMEEGDPIATRFGVLPQLSTLERMVQPKSESMLGGAADRALAGLVKRARGFTFAESPNPPLILFIWGARRVVPVNVTSLAIKETEFSTLLDPVRATVRVSLTVIEGPNPVSAYSRVLGEARSALNLAGVREITNVVIPG